MPDQPPHVTALSPDTISARVEMLRELFPEARAEDGLDFHKLREALGEFVDDAPERYSFSWAGKRDAIRLLQMPSRATLLPAPEESLDWDTTANLFIEGDNLEALKLLLRPYYGRVKMIYIDPPYNTGNDFIYPDDYRDPLGAYLEQTGEVKGQGDETHRNRITSGRKHSGWLSMMYPRLFLTRQLLREDGVILVSIDDNEVHNLRMLMNEVFGEECFLGTIVRGTGQTTGQDSGGFGSSFDYALAYSASDRYTVGGIPLSDKDRARFADQDERGQYCYWQLRKTGSNDKRKDRPKMFYPVGAPDGTQVLPIGPGGYESCWRFGETAYDRLAADGYIVWKRVTREGVEGWWPYVKQYLEEGTKRPSPLWTDLDGSKKATLELKDLFGERVFDNPKPTAFVKRVVGITCEADTDDLILDFFAGSCTTAQAVLELNREDGGNRRFIMVQLPEPTGQEEFATIADIGKERIRRVAARMKEADDDNLDLPEREAPEDLGFRVFKLAESNYRNWAGVDAEDTDGLPDRLAAQMELHADGLADGWTPEAVIAEVTLKEAGFGLGYAVEALGEALWRVTDPDTDRCFIISLADDLRLEDVEPLGLDKETLLVCRATALDDTTAGNLELQCRLRVI